MRRGQPPLRFTLGEPIDRTAVAEACQLLGHDPDDVIRIEMTPMTVIVTRWIRTEGGRLIRRAQNVRHVIR